MYDKRIGWVRENVYPQRNNTITNIITEGCQKGHITFPHNVVTRCYLQLVSETIQKAPFAEAQNALGKEKVRSMDRRYLSHCRNLLKSNCLSTQNFTEIGQSAAQIWPQTIFKMAADRHLEFHFFYIWSCDCHRGPNLHWCTKFHQNRLMFRWDMTILRF